MTQAASPDSWGRLASQAAEDEQRQHAIDNPGEYHGDIAAAELHWFADGTWLNRQPVSGEWRGFDAGTGEPCPGPAPTGALGPSHSMTRTHLSSAGTAAPKRTPASTRSTGMCCPARASVPHSCSRVTAGTRPRTTAVAARFTNVTSVFAACCSKPSSGPRC
jgi:hypothetical protein